MNLGLSGFGIWTSKYDIIEGYLWFESKADLDGDREVSSTDLSIVLGNMDKVGE